MSSTSTLDRVADGEWTARATRPETPTVLGHRPRVSHGVRLTRRGRVVVTLAALVLLLVAFALGRVDGSTAEAAVAAVTPTSSGQVLTQTVVQPGETLWQIAQRVAPDNDPREVIRTIRQLNDLEGTLRAGQLLVLPAAG